MVRISYKEHYQGVYPFDEISAAEFGFEKLSRLTEVLFCYFFFHLHLFNGVRFQYSSVPVNFLFFFLILCWFGSFIPSVIFHYELGSCFFAKFYYYILAVYSYCLCQCFQFFFIFCNQLDVAHNHNYHFSLLRVFHTSVSRWLLTGVWVTASLLKFLGLFSVFLPILTIMLIGGFPFFLLFSSLLASVPIIW